MNRRHQSSGKRARFASIGIALVSLALGSGEARAANPITFRWETRALVTGPSSWNASMLLQEGYGHFVVNGQALPTRTVPGQYKKVLFRLGGGQRFVDAEYNLFEAPLLVPLGIMHAGANTVHFTYGSVLEHSYSYDNITAHGSAAGNFTLFRLATGSGSIGHWYGLDDGTPDALGRLDGDEIAEGNLNYTINLPLEKVDPQLAIDIKNFEAALEQDRDALVQNASQIHNLAQQLANLEQLKKDLAALLTQDLGGEMAIALEALLARYPEIPPATRQALVRVIVDLQKSIADMQAELNRITSDFGQQTDQVVGTVERPSAGNGWDPDDLSNYVTSIDPNTIAGVTVPDTSGAISFDTSHDSYAAYADQIITKLGQYVRNTDVIARKDFLSIVRGWRDNQKALEDALRTRGYPVKETAAFNAARNRVTDYLRRYTDGKDWFLDNPVPPATRDAIDRVLAAHFLSSAQRLKEAMNEWRGSALTSDEQLATETVNGLAAGSEDIDENDFDTRAHLRSAIEGIVAGISGGVRLGIGFVPVVGDSMDMCEAFTGHEFCSSTGKSLSISDRIMSGLGVVIGSGKMWRAAANGVTGAAAIVVIRVGKFSDHLSDLPVAERKKLIELIGHVITHFDDLSGTELKRFVEKFGELPIMQLGPHIKGAGFKQLDDLKFFEKLMPAATVAHAKTHGALVKGLPSLAGKNIADIRTMVKNLGFVPHPGSTAQEVWTHADGSVIRIATAGTGFRPGPHLKKEIAKTAHAFGMDDIACKISDAGAIVPAGPTGGDGAKALLSRWFSGIVGRVPDATGNGELDLLANVWGEATHIPYSP